MSSRRIEYFPGKKEHHALADLDLSTPRKSKTNRFSQEEQKPPPDQLRVSSEAGRRVEKALMASLTGASQITPSEVPLFDFVSDGIIETRRALARSFPQRPTTQNLASLYRVVCSAHIPDSWSINTDFDATSTRTSPDSLVPVSDDVRQAFNLADRFFDARLLPFFDDLARNSPQVEQALSQDAFEFSPDLVRQLTLRRYLVDSAIIIAREALQPTLTFPQHHLLRDVYISDGASSSVAQFDGVLVPKTDNPTLRWLHSGHPKDAPASPLYELFEIKTPYRANMLAAKAPRTPHTRYVREIMHKLAETALEWQQHGYSFPFPQAIRIFHPRAIFDHLHYRIPLDHSFFSTWALRLEISLRDNRQLTPEIRHQGQRLLKILEHNLNSHPSPSSSYSHSENSAPLIQTSFWDEEIT